MVLSTPTLDFAFGNSGLSHIGLRIALIILDPKYKNTLGLAYVLTCVPAESLPPYYEVTLRQGLPSERCALHCQNIWQYANWRRQFKQNTSRSLAGARPNFLWIDPKRLRYLLYLVQYLNMNQYDCMTALFSVFLDIKEV